MLWVSDDGRNTIVQHLALLMNCKVNMVNSQCDKHFKPVLRLCGKRIPGGHCIMESELVHGAQIEFGS